MEVLVKIVCSKQHVKTPFETGVVRINPIRRVTRGHHTPRFRRNLVGLRAPFEYLTRSTSKGEAGPVHLK
jgi:hypothetical protein